MLFHVAGPHLYIGMYYSAAPDSCWLVQGKQIKSYYPIKVQLSYLRFLRRQCEYRGLTLSVNNVISIEIARQQVCV